ncbi:MAG: Tn3 family transposase [Oligoflexia bacterium]|nr:Tn3 family transposase [Oligoflexia bacterium]
MANCVLYYNSTMLDKLMKQSNYRGETKISEFIKHLSPVAWTHVNFQGKYEFLATNEIIDIDTWLKNIVISEADFYKEKVC